MKTNVLLTWQPQPFQKLSTSSSHVCRTQLHPPWGGRAVSCRHSTTFWGGGDHLVQSEAETGDGVWRNAVRLQSFNTALVDTAASPTASPDWVSADTPQLGDGSRPRKCIPHPSFIYSSLPTKGQEEGFDDEILYVISRKMRHHLAQTVEAAKLA